MASITCTELDSEASRRRLWEKLTMARIGPVKYNPRSGIRIEHGLLRSAVEHIPDVPRLASLLAPPPPFPLPAWETPVLVSHRDLRVDMQVSVRWVWTRARKDGRRQSKPAWEVEGNELDDGSADDWVRASVVGWQGCDVLVEYVPNTALGKWSGKIVPAPIGHVGVGWPRQLGWPRLCEGKPVCARYAPPPCLRYLLRYTPEALFTHPLFTNKLK